MSSLTESTIPAHTNWFLANLPEHEYMRLKPDLEYVSLKAGTTLYSAGENIHHIYFPVDCLISSLLVSREGTEVEVQSVGAEGFTGHTALLGNRQASSRAMVVVGGDAWRLPVGWFREEFKQSGVLHDFVLYHVHSQIVHSNQLSLCHRLHSVEERLCRWLLTAADVTSSNEIPLTHELLAQLLGSRRPGITIATNTLRQAGLIDSRRGHIVITNPAELSNCSCECYGVVRQSMEASVAAMLRRGGPMNCSRYLLARQSELLVAKGSDARVRSQEIQVKIRVLNARSAALLERGTTAAARRASN